ncbi:MAG: hypothetical protein R3B40_32295, partial [Polyangiales bacterium]
MDPRLKKFSFDEAQLRALDDAITILVAFDVIEQLKKWRHSRDVCFAVLQSRLTRSGRSATHILGTQPFGSRLHDQIKVLCADIEPALRTMTPLQGVLALTELRTASPYAEFPDAVAAKVTVSSSARDAASLRVGVLIDLRLPEPPAVATVTTTVAQAVSDATSAHTSFWGPLLKAVGGGALAVAVGVFAGPFIGGLVGTYLLGLS